MTINKHFHFDEDLEIYAMDVYSDAKDRKDEAEAAEKLAEARSEAVGLIVGKISRYFRYLGYNNTDHCAAAGNVWEYVSIEKAAKQAMRSLRIADVPADIIRDAAIIMSNSNDDICIAISKRIEEMATQIIANDNDDDDDDEYI